MSRGCSINDSSYKHTTRPRLEPPRATSDRQLGNSYERTFINDILLVTAVFIWTYLIGEETAGHIIAGFQQWLGLCAFCSAVMLLIAAIDFTMGWRRSYVFIKKSMIIYYKTSISSRDVRFNFHPLVSCDVHLRRAE